MTIGAHRSGRDSSSDRRTQLCPDHRYSERLVVDDDFSEKDLAEIEYVDRIAADYARETFRQFGQVVDQGAYDIVSIIQPLF